MKPVSNTLDEVVKAIAGSGGIKTAIASRLGVSRQTVDNYLSRWETARAAYEQEVENNKDIAESVILANIRTAAKLAQQGVIAESGDAWKYLKFKARERGYVERMEHTGADGGAIETKATVTIYLPDNGRG